jgi:hypothetical protein
MVTSACHELSIDGEAGGRHLRGQNGKIGLIKSDAGRILRADPPGGKEKP